MTDSDDKNLQAALLGYAQLFGWPGKFDDELDEEERVRLLDTNRDGFVRSFNKVYQKRRKEYAQIWDNRGEGLYDWVKDALNGFKIDLGFVARVREGKAKLSTLYKDRYDFEKERLSLVFGLIFSTLEFALADRRLYNLPERKVVEITEWMLGNAKDLSRLLRSLGNGQKPIFVYDRINQIVETKRSGLTEPHIMFLERLANEYK